MEPRGRGRARGRARGEGAGHPAPAPPGFARGPSQPPAQQQGPPGAWAVRPPQQVQQPPAFVRPPAQMPTQQHVAGRGSRQGVGGEEGASSQPITGEKMVVTGGEEGGPVASGGRRGGAGGNGGVRGRTNRNEIIHTKPESMKTKKGTSGKTIQLTANYFALVQKGQWVLNQYRVDFSPELDNTGQRKFLLREGMKGRIAAYLFDGTVLYTPATINPDPLELFVQNQQGDNFRITVKRVGDVAWGDHHYIQIFNIIIRNCLQYMKLQLVGREYYDPQAKNDLSEYKLELWPGYYTSMRQHEQNILLNCNLTFKTVRQDNCYDLLMECQGGGRNVKQDFQMKIIGSVILTYYNNRTYRIDDVDFLTTPSSTFKLRDGSEITYIDYYKQKYNVNVRVPNQPMLISKSKPREIRAGMSETLYLIPELCKMTGLTDRQRENFHLMKAMAQYTRVDPKTRMAKLMQFSEKLKRNPDCVTEIRRWDLALADSLVKFDARVLKDEAIVTGRGKKTDAGEKADWTSVLRNMSMFHAGQMDRMAVVCPSKCSSACNEFIGVLKKVCSGLQWSVGNPRVFEIRDDRASTYLDELEKIVSFNPPPTLILCVLPSMTQDRYAAIKKKCYVDRGIPNQVVLAKNLTKGMSIATKVAIQLNCKIGGSPWSVIMPLSGLMVVGYDVCRDTANKGKSFGAMVASMDKQVTRYFSMSMEHKMEEELSDNFSAFLILACERYKEQSDDKRYPERILIYRDGVGDGQLPYVYDHEVMTIKKKLSENIYKGQPLKMAFVVVSKRINARFFAGASNPPPGTVVDDVVTLPERYDFFIVSQCVREGTVSPTSYNVIEDTMGLDATKMQILTYKLCHMYFNWSGTVRVPAPCQYAHKLAFLTAQHLHRPAHRALETTLYYL